MADDSASSKGVSRGDSSGTKGSGSTKTSSGSVSKSSSSKSTGSGNKSGVGGGGGGGGGSTGTRGSSVGSAAGSNNRSSGSGNKSGVGGGGGGGGGGDKNGSRGSSVGTSVGKGTGSGSIGSKGGGASSQRPGAGGNAGQVKGSTLARAEATNFANRERSTRNVSQRNDAPQGAFGPRAGFGNYLSTEQSLNTPTAGLGSYITKDQSRIGTVRTDLGVAGVPGGVPQRYVQDNAMDPYKGRPRGGVAGIASAGPIAVRPETPGSYPAAPKTGYSFGGFNPDSPVQREAIQQGLGSIPAPPTITDAQKASWEQANASARAAANPAYVGLSNLATNAPEASMAFANTEARWKAFNSVNPITESPPPTSTAVASTYRAPNVVPGMPAGVTNYGPFVDRYSFNPSEQLAQVSQQYGSPAPTPYATAILGSQAALANRSPEQVSTVAEAFQPRAPSYDYGGVDISNPQGYPQAPSYDYGGIDLPDPQAPTKQYVGVTYPGLEGYRPGNYGGTNTNSGNVIQVVPTSGPATPTAPTAPTTGSGSTTAPGNEWFKYYGTPQPYQTLVATPAPVIMNPAPISQGAGSLLPNIVVKPVFG